MVLIAHIIRSLLVHSLDFFRDCEKNKGEHERWRGEWKRWKRGRRDSRVWQVHSTPISHSLFFQFNSHLPPTEFHHSLSSLSQSFTPKLEMQMQEIKEEKESVRARDWDWDMEKRGVMYRRARGGEKSLSSLHFSLYIRPHPTMLTLINPN